MAVINHNLFVYLAAISCNFLFGISNANQTKSDILIESPQVTNYGDWGVLELCPPGTYAAGMELKVGVYAAYQDDTAVNGIRLFCIAPGTNEFSDAVGIVSSECGWGSWGESYFCDKGVITGFQLNSEPEQGSSGDNTAANNLRIFCSNLQGGFLEGDGLPWGDWTEPQNCLSQQAVCGIKTQIAPNAKSRKRRGDDTALNNVVMKCCEVSNIGETCKPNDNWETVFECDNTRSSEPMKCTYEKTRGISRSSTASATLIHEYNVMLSIGFSASVLYNGLSANFRHNLSMSENTGYSWKSESSETWNEATTVTAEFVIPGGMRSKLSQAVGNCGFFDVFSNFFRKEDFNSVGQNCGTNFFYN